MFFLAALLGKRPLFAASAWTPGPRLSDWAARCAKRMGGARSDGSDDSRAWVWSEGRGGWLSPALIYASSSAAGRLELRPACLTLLSWEAYPFELDELPPVFSKKDWTEIALSLSDDDFEALFREGRNIGFIPFDESRVLASREEVSLNACLSDDPAERERRRI